MSIFSISIAIIIALISLIPIKFVQSKKLRGWLIADAVLMFVVSAWLVQAFVYPHYLSKKFENQLRQQPIFDVIAKHNPEAFAAFIEKVRVHAQDENGAEIAARYSAELINSVFFQYLEKAPNEYIELYLKATLELYQYLNGLSPRTILKLENIAIDDPALASVWEDKQFRSLLGHLLDTKRYIIEAAIREPVQPPTAEQANVAIDKVLGELNQVFTARVVKQVFSAEAASMQPNVAAQVIITFYQLILVSGKESAGSIIRYMASVKSAQSKALEKQEGK